MSSVRRIAAVSLLCAVGAPASADVVLEWNEVTKAVMTADLPYQNPGMTSRTLALVNLAMYDAINGVSPRHEQFYEHAPAPAGASAEAAGAQAAYRVLMSIYPEQAALLDAAVADMLAEMPDGPGKMDGIAYGDAVGAHIVALRADDGFDTVVEYEPTPLPGHWQPDPLNPHQEAWGPAWGELRTFAISSVFQMHVPPVGDMTSVEYAESYNEVKSLGALNSTTRTAEQTEIGLFWALDRAGMGTPMVIYTDALLVVAEQQGNDLWENAHLFAMAGVAMADAGCVAWDAKYRYDFWRPVTGIRQGDFDGNPDTVGDPTWTPLGAPGGVHPDGSTINNFTPPFPTYLSGHATFGGAAFRALERFYGTDSIPFQLESPELPGVVRSFSSFSQAMEENGRSRVYLGIHWNFDDTVGRQVGSEIADYIAEHHFLPVEACLCELDGADGVNVFDLLAYLDAWFAHDASANLDGQAGVDVFDLLMYLDCWFPASAGAC